MKYRFTKTVELKISGRNIERFIRRLLKNNIALLNIKKIDNQTIVILVYSKDIEKIDNIKTIYEVVFIKNHGLLKLKDLIKKNKILIIFLLLGYIFLMLLASTIFSVEVIHTDKELRKLLIEELEEYGIKKYNLKKNYNSLTKIKNEITNKYKDKIEWLEIEETGTKYIVRVEERILNNNSNNNEYQDIVAKKDAIIMEINATSGQIVKNKLDYVKAGDTIISGYITLNENIKKTVHAEGNVYGEVWYKVSIEYPLHYEEITETKNEKKVLSIKFLNKSYALFNLKKYKDKKVESKKILESNLLPFSLTLDTQKEVNIINETYTKEKAIEKSKQKIKDSIESKLSENEYIIGIKQLKVEENNSTIILDAFVTVYENITSTKKIDEFIKLEH